MIKITDKSKCSGCHACYSVCPTKCINMEYDIEGFLYPVVDAAKCINCNSCERVCPIIKTQTISNNISKAYACYYKDTDIRLSSSSGGVFTALASYILDHNGHVFGAAFDSELNVIHQIVKKSQDLNILRGAKYVQSKIGDTFLKVKQLLDNGELVYFSGTPCQIDGLHSFLQKEYNHLICQDIICHGVPSPKVWNKYVEENGFNSNDHISFRNKDTGWENYSFKVQGDHEFKELASNNLYMKVFLSNLCLRPSCYDCHSKSLNRNSDITLGDFWGIDNIDKEMNDHKGTSLVLIHSEKGKKIFKKIESDLVLKEVSIDEAIQYNPSAIKNSTKPKNREIFIENVPSDNLNNLFEKYKNKKTIKQYLSSIKRKVKAIVKNR